MTKRLFALCNLAPAILLCGTAIVSSACASQQEPLRRAGATPLPGYSGDFDHSAADLAGNRLFVAAEDHGTVEVFNLRTGAHLTTITGTETPHSFLLMPDVNRLLVTDTGKQGAKLFDATSYKLIGTIQLTPGSDSVGYDAPRKRLYVVTGGKDVDMKDCWIEEIDPRSGEKIGKLHFDSNHTEAMAVEQNGPHLYVNITDKNYLAVVDKTKLTVEKTYPIHEAEQNAPIAMDEANNRLFVITRKPGKMIVLNPDTGATIASFKAPGRTDETIFDRANKRLYVLGGEGYIGVFQENDPDHYVNIANVPSAPGAKTGILVPELKRLYVSVSPGDTKATAQEMWFDVLP